MKNSQSDSKDFQKPKPPNWRAGYSLARASGALKRGPFGILNIHSVANFQKKLKGDLLETFENFRKEIEK